MNLIDKVRGQGWGEESQYEDLKFLLGERVRLIIKKKGNEKDAETETIKYRGIQMVMKKMYEYGQALKMYKKIKALMTKGESRVITIVDIGKHPYDIYNQNMYYNGLGGNLPLKRPPIIDRDTMSIEEIEKIEKEMESDEIEPEFAKPIIWPKGDADSVSTGTIDGENVPSKGQNDRGGYTWARF